MNKSCIMKNWISFTISVAAFAISILALAILIPTDMTEGSLDFDYIGALIGVLSFLVTLLIGYQIYTVINVKEELREIQKERQEIEKTIKQKVEEVKTQMKNDISNLLPILIAIDTDEISDMVAVSMRIHQKAEEGSMAESFADGVIESFLNKGIPEDEEAEEKYWSEFAENLDSESVAHYYAFFLKKNAEEREKYRDVEKILVRLISILSDKMKEGKV